MDENWEALQQSMQMGLQQIRPFVIILQNLKQRQRRPKDKKLHGKANRYQEYYNEFSEAISRLTSEDYYYGREPLPGSSQANIRKHRQTLLTLMYEAFIDHLEQQVTENVPNRYSQQAIFESITSILNTFAITDDRNHTYTTGSIKRFLLREEKERKDAFFGDKKPKK